MTTADGGKDADETGGSQQPETPPGIEERYRIFTGRRHEPGGRQPETPVEIPGGLDPPFLRYFGRTPLDFLACGRPEAWVGIGATVLGGSTFVIAGVCSFL